MHASAREAKRHWIGARQRRTQLVEGSDEDEELAGNAEEDAGQSQRSAQVRVVGILTSSAVWLVCIIHTRTPNTIRLSINQSINLYLPQ